MGTKQMKVGNSCEELVVKILREKGYWVYNLPLKTSGQPVDIIAATGTENGEIIYLLDAKHVREEEPSFPLNRIEPNQWASLDYAKNFAGLKNLGFAILFERTKDVYWLSYELAITLYKGGAKSVKLTALRKFTEVI